MYAPMRVLRLADQQVPAMDKLYYYILQTDRMLLKWLPEAEMRANSLRTDSMLNAMLNLTEVVPVLKTRISATTKKRNRMMMMIWLW
jgi:hypothetical protein